jgi:hypothetical protein
MKYYYITDYNPTVKVTLEPCEIIDLTDMSLIELVLPPCKRIYCWGNYLKELILPEGCVYASCMNNNLTKLIVPKNCIELYCWSNKLPKVIKNLLESHDYIKMQLANSLQTNSSKR